MTRNELAELPLDNVIFDTIYDHLSPSRRRRWVAAYQRTPGAEVLSAWSFGLAQDVNKVWCRLVRQALSHENWGLIFHARGKVREAVARVDGLYRRLADGDYPSDAEWDNIAVSIRGHRSWRLFSRFVFWRALGSAAIVFGVIYSLPVMRWEVLIAGSVLWWSNHEIRKLEVPSVPHLQVRAALVATFERRMPDEEREANVLTCLADAYVAANMVRLQKEFGIQRDDEEERAELRREYWNWLAETLLLVLRNLTTKTPLVADSIPDDLFDDGLFDLEE